MNTPHAWRTVIVWIGVAMTWGCGETSGVGGAPAAGTSTPENATEQTGGSTGTSVTGPAASSGGNSRSSAVAGSPISDAGRTGSSEQSTAADGGATSDAGAAADGGSSEAVGGSGGTSGQPTEPAVPTPVDSPQIWGFGVGVSDVSAAKDYFKDIMKLEVQKESFKRDGWTETMLYSTLELTRFGGQI